MSDKPILFSSEMVRAILGGRKTQTRRVIKPQPTLDGNAWAWKGYADVPHGKWWEYAKVCGACRCQVGDRLWVRETWCPVDDTFIEGGTKWVDYRATPQESETHPAGWNNDPDSPDALKWWPSIFMPRWASRITLEVTDVRAQRVQEISEADAMAEGCDAYINPHGLCTENPRDYMMPKDTWRDGFAKLWDSINAKRGYGWDVNPWVWVVEFAVAQK